MSEETAVRSAQELERAATRYAVELVDKMFVPHTYNEAVTLISVAWLEGAAAQLKWARDFVRGDEPRGVARIYP